MKNDYVYTYDDWKKDNEEFEEIENFFIELLEFVEDIEENGIPAGEEDEYKRVFSNCLPMLFDIIKMCMDGDSLFEHAPIPFEKEDVPLFPIDSLPIIVSNYVKAVSENTQTSHELSGILSLGVLAVSQQGKNIVQVTPDYHEQSSLYSVAMLASGERKSAVIRHMTRPFNIYETDYNRVIAPEVERRKIEKRILEGEIKRLETRIIRDGLDKETEAELQLRVHELADFRDIYFLRLLINDVTAEKLIDIMDKQGGRIGISSAEGNLFDLLATKNERGTNLLEPLLKGYSGDSLTVDRLTRESNFIEKPHISTILTVQPYVISKFMANAEFGGRGLFSRFSIVKCGSFIGSRSSTSPDIPENIKEEYNDLIFDLLNQTTERVFLLSPEAEEERQHFHDIIEKRLINEWHFMRDYGAKFLGTTIRVAGLIHGAESRGKFYKLYINGSTFKRAISIAECLGKHAEIIYLNNGINEDVEKAKYILSRLKSAMKYNFSKGEMLNLCGKYKADELSASIKILEDHDYIKIVKTESGGKGRPSEMVYINPEIDLLK